MDWQAALESTAVLLIGAFLGGLLALRVLTLLWGSHLAVLAGR